MYVTVLLNFEPNTGIAPYVVQTGSGAPPASYSMGTGGGGLSPGIKRTMREDDHSPLTTAEVKETWIYTSTPPYAFME
jgi:hypothetical protein